MRRSVRSCAIVAVVAAASLTEVSSAGQMPQRRPSRLLHWSNRNWKPDHVSSVPGPTKFHARQMSERLARASAFALEAEEVYDEVPDQSPRRQLTNLRRVAMRRPDRLVGDAFRRRHESDLLD